MNKENENEKVQNKVALNEQKDKKNTNTDEKLNSIIKKQKKREK